MLLEGQLPMSKRPCFWQNVFLTLFLIFTGCDGRNSESELNRNDSSSSSFEVQTDQGHSDTRSAAKEARAISVEPILEPERTQFRALLIGVNDYERLQDLKYCEQDVTALKAQLAQLGFEEDQIVCLTASDDEPIRRPTSRNIKEQLNSLFAGLDEESVLLIALSGHGGAFEFRGSDGRIRTESFYCPLDARLGKPRETMISVKSIYDRLDACPARFKMLLVDACRDRQFAPPGGRSAIDAARSMANFSKSLLNPSALPKATLALVSCTSGEQSYEHPSLGHGVFMHYVLEALAGKADTDRLGDRNGVISYRELRDYVYRNTSDYVRKEFEGRHQTPNFYTSWETSDFDLWPVLRRDSPRIHVLIVANVGDVRLGEGLLADVETLEKVFWKNVPPAQLNLRTLLSENTNADFVMKAIRDDFAVSPQDTFVLIYCGHGTCDEDGEHYFGLASSSLLPRSEVESAIKRKKARLGVLISDSSAVTTEMRSNERIWKGTYRANPSLKTTDRDQVVNVRDDVSSLFGSLFLQSKGLVNINSASQDQLSFVNVHNGSFSTQVLSRVLSEHTNHAFQWTDLIDEWNAGVNEYFPLLLRGKTIESQDLWILSLPSTLDKKSLPKDLQP